MKHPLQGYSHVHGINKLKQNDEKTHLLVMGPKNWQATYQVRIITSTDIIRPTSSEKLLGCYIRKDMPWAEYIKLNKESLMKSLNLRLRAVKKIRYLTTFKNRKMIAEGIFISKVSYLITLWWVLDFVRLKLAQPSKINFSWSLGWAWQDPCYIAGPFYFSSQLDGWLAGLVALEFVNNANSAPI